MTCVVYRASVNASALIDTTALMQESRNFGVPPIRALVLRLRLGRPRGVASLYVVAYAPAQHLPHRRECVAPGSLLRQCTGSESGSGRDIRRFDYLGICRLPARALPKLAAVAERDQTAPSDRLVLPSCVGDAAIGAASNEGVTIWRAPAGSAPAREVFLIRPIEGGPPDRP